ncbi:MAG TPA: ferritin family protein [Treponemataceae bacterium]|nr:ferritin family protein [Treponemataceae bacterium]
MPEFGTPFSVKKSDRKLTHTELVRSIRMMVAAEYEAIQLYQEIAESTDNVLARNVLIDIADEEKVHAGEFLRLLHELDPAEQGFYDEGAREVEEEFLSGSGGESGAGGEAGADLGIGSLRNKGEQRT